MKYLLLVVSIFGLDEGIKQRIDKKEPLGKERRVPKLPVVIEKYYNNGAALNLLAKKPKIMLGLHLSLIHISQDLMCGAPNEVTEQQLREVHIKVRD